MNAVPAECSIGLKEWSGICRALAEGRQTILLRKGGIDEGPGGFTPEHSAFWLYPTHVHQAQQGLREYAEEEPEPTVATAADPARASVPIRALALVHMVHHIDRAALLPVLTPFHVWTLQTVEKRFAYRRPGLWVLGVRVFLRADPWILAPTEAQLGCKSWVELDLPITTEGLVPVLASHNWSARGNELRAVLGLGPKADADAETGSPFHTAGTASATHDLTDRDRA